MRLEEAINVVGTLHFDTILSLSNIHSVVVRHETRVFERNDTFQLLGWELQLVTNDIENVRAGFLIFTSEHKIIHLSDNEYSLVEDIVVLLDASIVSGRCETHFLD